MSNIIGKNVRWYRHLHLPINLDRPAGENVSVVLVAGAIGDYAAYVGLGQDFSLIAEQGDKLSFEEARCHFPGIEREKYRD